MSAGDQTAGGRSRHYLAGPPTPPRCLVMEILTATPDSFSDGVRWLTLGRAEKRTRQLIDEGADLVDVGGGSTRPGVVRTDAKVDQDRLLPVVRELVRQGISPSVDAMPASMASMAIEAGGSAINDVPGGLPDPDMHRVVDQARAPFVAMHWRGHLRRLVLQAAV